MHKTQLYLPIFTTFVPCRRKMIDQHIQCQICSAPYEGWMCWPFLYQAFTYKSAYAVENNFRLFERLFKVQKKGVFLFGMPFSF